MPKHFVSNTSESIKLFDKGILEALSKVHFTIPLVTFLPVIGYFLYLSFFERSYDIVELFSLSILGLFAWTFVEYVMHRFVFHYEPTTSIGKKIHFLAHGVHHDYPNDAKRLVLPPSVSIPLAICFYYFFKFSVGAYYFPFFYASFLMGYLAYDMIHFAIHHFKINNKYWAAIKEHHMKHHYKESDAGFGVSSPIWDAIFNSGFKSEKTGIQKIDDLGSVDKVAELS